MVRVSDARMSGTSYGTCVLHVTPESAIGGPLAAIKEGDIIDLDVESRTISLNISEDEMIKRTKDLPERKNLYARGYTKLYINHLRKQIRVAILISLKVITTSQNLRYFNPC